MPTSLASKSPPARQLPASSKERASNESRRLPEDGRLIVGLVSRLPSTEELSAQASPALPFETNIVLGKGTAKQDSWARCHVSAPPRLAWLQPASPDSKSAFSRIGVGLGIWRQLSQASP